VLRFKLLETLRARLFALPGTSCGGVMVCTEFVEGAWAGWYNSIWLYNPGVIKGSRNINKDKTLFEDFS
jgi:hypothetical protein